MDEEEKTKEQLEELEKVMEQFGGEKEFLKFLKDFDLEKIKKQIKADAQIKNYSELLNWSVRERFKTLSTVSALSATLLIVATFNDKLLVLNDLVRVLLSILLALIPISLWALMYELFKAESHGFKRMKEIVKEVSNTDISEKIKKEKSFRGLIPWIINGIFTIVIVFIIVLIW